MDPDWKALLADPALVLDADPAPGMMLIRADPVPDQQHCYIGLQQDFVTNSCLYLYRVYPNCCLQLPFLIAAAQGPGDHYAEGV
jgi:hypothetical protein